MKIRNRAAGSLTTYSGTVGGGMHLKANACNPPVTLKKKKKTTTDRDNRGRQINAKCEETETYAL